MICLVFVLFLLSDSAHSHAATQDHSRINFSSELEKKLFEAAQLGDFITLRQVLDQRVSPNAKEENSQRTPLFYAVQRGDRQAVRLLLDRGATPNTTDAVGMTPLMVAAKLSDNVRTEVVRILVDAKADIDAQSPYGDTAILLAAESGFTDTVLFLAGKGSSSSVQSGLNLALLRAAQRGKLADVTNLLKRGANPNAQPLALKPSGEIAFRADTPLIESANGRHLNIAWVLLDAGADTNLPGHRGRTALMASVQQGGETTKILLDHGANPNDKDDFGRSSLMHAVMNTTDEKGRTDAIQLLMKVGADVNARDNSGNSVGQLAIASGNVHDLSILTEKGAGLEQKDSLKAAAEFASRNGLSDVAKLLLSGNDLNGMDKAGLTILMRVAQRGHAGMLKVLVYLGSKPNLQDNNGMTALMYAARYRHTNAVRALLASGAAPNTKDKKGTAALIMAIPTYWVALNPNTHVWARGHEAPNTVRALIQGGADPNLTDADGLTPLVFAAGRGQAEIVKMLLASGADLSAKSAYGINAYHVAAGEDVVEILRQARTATSQPWQMPKTSLKSRNNLLVLAALHGHVGVIEVLFKEGADPNFRGDFFGRTPLLAAVTAGKLSSVEMLLRHKADPNVTDIRNGTAPLLDAMDRDPKSRDSETAARIATILLDAGANVNASNTFGLTPLAKASGRGNAELVRLLLLRGASPNIKDQAGKTPLIHFVEHASSSVSTDVVRLLIDAGADVNAIDLSGRSATDIATSRNRPDIVALLKRTK